jgi:hypothetical protein
MNKWTPGQLGKTNPIQTQFKANQTQLKPIKANKTPKQTQFKPKQTQFQNVERLLDLQSIVAIIVDLE